MAEIVTIDEAKAYLRVDHDDDDQVIERIIVSAREYVETATGLEIYLEGDSPPAQPIPSRAVLAILLLTSHWYDTREVVVVGQAANEVPYSVRRILNQLKDWKAR